MALIGGAAKVGSQWQKHKSGEGTNPLLGLGRDAQSPCLSQTAIVNVKVCDEADGSFASGVAVS
jgi:hypothetical protein